MARTTCTLVLTPVDVLMFRDSRPFDTGGEAKSIFPLPQTVDGAVRRWLMDCFDVSADDVWKNCDKDSNRPRRELFREAMPEDRRWIHDIFLDGPFLERSRCIYLPVPRHMMYCEDDETLVPSLPLDDKNGFSLPRVTSNGLLPQSVPPLWVDSKRDFTFLPGWMEENTVNSILQGGLANGVLNRRDCILPDSDFFLPEARVRTALDAETGHAADGLLFTTVFMRLREHVGLRLGISSGDENLVSNLIFAAEKTPWITLGGEKRVVMVEVRNEPPLSDDGQAGDADRLITYMATPGLFYSPYPKNVVEQGWWLCGAATGDPLPVSGWNSGSKLPRKTRYATRAGAIYFWKKNRDDANMPIHVCADPRDNRVGWGRMLRGGSWNYYAG